MPLCPADAASTGGSETTFMPLPVIGWTNNMIHSFFLFCFFRDGFNKLNIDVIVNFVIAVD